MDAFWFCAPDVAEALFCCETEPSLPGLKTRTAMFSFSAPSCPASAPEFACWAFWFDWPAAWTPVAPAPAPVWFWPAAWVAAFWFCAWDVAEVVFCCDTDSSLPGLSTRTEMFRLLGRPWAAMAAEFASWAFWFDWPAAWTPVAPAPAPVWFWPAACMAAFWFCAWDVAEVVFRCDAEPPLPGLSTRTEMFRLLGWPWAATAAEFAL
jgi:hypothetical protein